MPKYLVLLLLCFCGVAVCAQPKKPAKGKRYRYDAYPMVSPHDDCVFNSKYTLGERLKRYPFNEAVTILAVSYHNFNGGQPNQEIRVDSLGKIIPTPQIDTLKYGLWIKQGALDGTSIVELVKLSKAQIRSLTNLIYNTDFRVKGNNGVDPGYNCFAPRNALLFFDKNGKIFDYIQICFACQNYESKSGRINLGTECYQKMDLAKKWFINQGVQFGTIKRDDE
ncbi:hypothetical protein C8P68_10883 [Mucilaginibacter yixingensis]|uniref:Uncharacterized protein n=1 Tax=Mucilaginibacter yixingensis TaxID=1295612 RepID=A0A2T5J5S5_9SPHI|nr:hypothetical protein [Mucilaginibacter yixingensis]PTQ93621.1 hypothetical protein C8P68_10883 [Mucilaginibacter yixingensis]